VPVRFGFCEKMGKGFAQREGGILGHGMLYVCDLSPACGDLSVGFLID